MKSMLTGGRKAASKVILAVSMMAALGGCNLFTRLADVGSEPPLTTIQNPNAIHGNRPVQMPMPAPVPVVHHPNSLWRPGSRAFFKDQRAAAVGDILTIKIAIDDEATINNTTTRSRNNTEDASLSAFLGYETRLRDFLPNAVDPTNLVDMDSDSLSEGSGSIKRDESIELDISAIVTQVLPNGNLVIAGRQEVRVNFEVRQLQIGGIVRPEDISSSNEIGFDKVAEARIAYGGRGRISEVQQPRYGQQIFDILWPF